MREPVSAVTASAAGRQSLALGDASTCEWLLSYLAPWWQDTEVADPVQPGLPTVRGVVDPDRFNHLRDWIDQSPTSVESFIRVPARRRMHQEILAAVCDTREIAYRRSCLDEQIEIDVVGTDAADVNLDVSRIARLLITDRLEAEGWMVMHAGCVVDTAGAAALILGHQGAGKTTTSLTLSRSGDLGLLANDRCLLRATDTGVEAIPWPGSISLGFGLLEALGWAATVTDHIRRGARQHPFQLPEVAGLLTGRDYTPRFGPSGRELKFELLPRDLTAWFGVSIAPHGVIQQILLPKVRPGTAPRSAIGQVDAGSLAEHLLSGPNSGYPNFLDLSAPEPAEKRPATAELLARLAEVECRNLTLGHDADRNAQALASAL